MTTIGPESAAQTIPTVRYGLAALSADWGRVEIADPAWGGERGWRDSTLTVYPPGTSATERMLLAGRARWTFWSITAGVVLCAVVAGSAPLPVALVAALAVGAVCVGGVLVASRRTRRVHSRIHRLTVRSISTGRRTSLFGDQRLFDACVAELLGLDEAERRGELSRVEHELVWAQVYDRIG